MKKLYRNDIILNVIIVAVCMLVPFCVMFMGGKNGDCAVISVDGKKVKSISLSENAKFEQNGVTVCVQDGKAYISASDCPDGTCMKMGKIWKSGQSVVCVPNRVSVKIHGDDKAGEKDGDDVVAG